MNSANSTSTIVDTSLGQIVDITIFQVTMPSLICIPFMVQLPRSRSYNVIASTFHSAEYLHNPHIPITQCPPPGTTHEGMPELLRQPWTRSCPLIQSSLLPSHAAPRWAEALVVMNSVWKKKVSEATSSLRRRLRSFSQKWD